MILLAQVKPGATTLTDAYTVPFPSEQERIDLSGLLDTVGGNARRRALQGAILRQIIVCNVGGAADTFRISHAPGGAADATSQYLFYGLSLTNGGPPFVAGDLNIPLVASDVIRVYSTGGNLTFHLHGDELV